MAQDLYCFSRRVPTETFYMYDPELKVKSGQYHQIEHLIDPKLGKTFKKTHGYLISTDLTFVVPSEFILGGE